MQTPNCFFDWGPTRGSVHTASDDWWFVVGGRTRPIMKMPSTTSISTLSRVVLFVKRGLKKRSHKKSARVLSTRAPCHREAADHEGLLRGTALSLQTVMPQCGNVKAKLRKK